MNEQLKVSFRFFLRYAIGGIFIYSGFSKVISPAEYFEVAIGYYEIFPNLLIPLIARTMPWVEFILGVFLFLGYWIRPTATILAVASLSFQVVLAQALMRRLPIYECGCFGGGLTHMGLYQAFLMDTFMTLGLIWIAANPKSPLSLDTKLLGNYDSASNNA